MKPRYHRTAEAIARLDRNLALAALAIMLAATAAGVALIIKYAHP